MATSVRIGFGGKRGLVWVLIASWLIPVMMGLAYVVLIATSDVDATGAAWEAIAFAFVLVLWFLFRILTEHAAVSRAIGVGDADRLLELSDFQLSRRRSPRARAPFHVYRALALDMRGDFAAALAEVDQATGATAAAAALAEVVRAAALAETGRVSDARAALARARASAHARDLQLDQLARLAEARILVADGDHDGARKLLARLCDDIRAGSGTRDRAKALLAKIAR